MEDRKTALLDYLNQFVGDQLMSLMSPMGSDIKKLPEILKFLRLLSYKDTPRPNIKDLHLVVISRSPIEEGQKWARLYVGLRFGHPDLDVEYTQQMMEGNDEKCLIWFTDKYKKIQEGLGAVKAYAVGFLDATSCLEGEDFVMEVHKLRIEDLKL